jgi:hypothetical protein
VLALMTNFMAFYYAAALFERSGILFAVTVFLITALPGTIIASVIEECLWPLLSKGSNMRSSRGRTEHSAVTTSLP